MPLLAFVMHTNAAMLESVNNPRLSRSMNDRFIQSCLVWYNLRGT